MGTVSFQNKSGTITTPGVSQVVSVANPNRTYLLLQNTSAGNIWYNFGSAASSGTSAYLGAGQTETWSSPGQGSVSTDPLNLVANTAGLSFALYESNVAVTVPSAFPTYTLPPPSGGVLYSGGVANLAWTSTHDPNFSKYNIRRNGVVIGTSSTTSYADSGPFNSGWKYNYTVTTVNIYGLESAPSTIYSINT